MTRLVINAVACQLGGGLSLTKLVAEPLLRFVPDVELTILASRSPVVEALRETFPNVDVRQVIPDAPAYKTFAWQNFRLGQELKRPKADAVVAFNHVIERCPCPQAVYHINLRRFSRDYRSGLKQKIAEGLRDRAAVRALQFAEANIFESQFLLDAAIQTVGPQFPIRNARVIHNAFPDDTFVNTPPELPPTTGPTRLLAVTNPNPHKDNPTLVRTLATLVERDPKRDWQLEIAGGADPTKWAAVREDAASLGVLDRITWLGFLDRSGLAEATARATAVISTSQMESFMLIGCEAMARGCPCVVSDCASMPESVGQAGLLAEPGNPQSFADQILRLTDSDFRANKVLEGLAFCDRYRLDACGRELASTICAIANTTPGGILSIPQAA